MNIWLLVVIIIVAAYLYIGLIFALIFMKLSKSPMFNPMGVVTDAKMTPKKFLVFLVGWLPLTIIFAKKAMIVIKTMKTFKTIDDSIPAGFDRHPENPDDQDFFGDSGNSESSDNSGDSDDQSKQLNDNTSGSSESPGKTD